MESGKVLVMRLSGRLVINLNFFKWSTSTHRRSVRKRLSFRPDRSCLRPPHSSSPSITITGCSSCATIEFGQWRLNERFENAIDIGWSVFFSALTKCWRRRGYRRVRSEATTRHKSSIVIVDCLRSNQNDITCRPWSSSSRVAMLAANADFPTPGDPLIWITLWPSVLLISVSICCRMSRRVPSIHDSRRESLFPSRALNKSPSFFCSVTVFASSGIEGMSHTR